MGGRSWVVTVARHISRHSAGGSGCPAAFLLEPQHRRAEDAALAEVVARPRLDGAEIFTDHDSAGAVRLENEDPHQRLVVVADVRTFGGRTARRHPPQPEQPDDVTAYRVAGQVDEVTRDMGLADFGKQLTTVATHHHPGSIMPCPGSARPIYTTSMLNSAPGSAPSCGRRLPK